VLKIDADGICSVLALSEISRQPKVDRPLQVGINQTENATSKCVVTTMISGSPTSEEWRIQHTLFPQSDVVSCLSKRVGCNPSGALSAHKLWPNVDIAIPLSIITKDEDSGRLYTYLPLPLPTGFPAHINSLFALTQSRQHLRNHEEKGLVRGSTDR
jgi:hypothetical protein